MPMRFLSFRFNLLTQRIFLRSSCFDVTYDIDVWTQIPKYLPFPTLRQLCVVTLFTTKYHELGLPKSYYSLFRADFVNKLLSPSCYHT